MSKYSSKTQLSQKESEKLFIEFCHYMAEMRSPTEMAKAFSDLLSKQEMSMIARRLKIAIDLLNNYKYTEIMKHLKVSQATIARVNAWLRESGDGFRLMYQRGRKFRQRPSELTESQREWRRFRRRYPMHFWPQLMIEEIIKNANASQRKKFTTLLNQMDKKIKLQRSIAPNIGFNEQ